LKSYPLVGSIFIKTLWGSTRVFPARSTKHCTFWE